jgi:hypothetical protein
MGGVKAKKPGKKKAPRRYGGDSRRADGADDSGSENGSDCSEEEVEEDVVVAKGVQSTAPPVDRGGVLGARIFDEIGGAPMDRAAAGSY